MGGGGGSEIRVTLYTGVLIIREPYYLGVLMKRETLLFGGLL